MTVMALPPSGTPPTSMTVSSSFTSRETSLNGCETRSASATPGIEPNRSSGSSPVGVADHGDDLPLGAGDGVRA